VTEDEIIATLDPDELGIMFLLLVLLHVETFFELRYVLNGIAHAVTFAATRRSVRRYCTELVQTA